MQVRKTPGASENLKQAITALDNIEVKVGWFPSSRYESGAPVAGVAYVQEFGSPSRGIPPRLGLRALTQDKRTEWAKLAGNLVKAVANGNLAPNALAEGLGQAAVGAIKENISRITSPPLEQGTVDARKRKLANGGKGATAGIAKPLVDTGILLNSVDYEVTAR